MVLSHLRIPKVINLCRSNALSKRTQSRPCCHSSVKLNHLMSVVGLKKFPIYYPFALKVSQFGKLNFPQNIQKNTLVYHYSQSVFSKIVIVLQKLKMPAIVGPSQCSIPDKHFVNPDHLCFLDRTVHRQKDEILVRIGGTPSSGWVIWCWWYLELNRFISVQHHFSFLLQ